MDAKIPERAVAWLDRKLAGDEEGARAIVEGERLITGKDAVTLSAQQVSQAFDETFNHRIFTPMFAGADKPYATYKEIFLEKLGLCLTR